jgi:hypothetical protein
MVRRWMQAGTLVAVAALSIAEAAERRPSSGVLVTPQGVVRPSGARATPAQSIAPASPGSHPVGGGGTRATDAVVLDARKVGTDIQLSWSGQASPVTVLRSEDAPFEKRVTTLADESSLSGLDVPLSNTAEAVFFEVVDDTVVSRAVQGMGYNPMPAPQVGGAGRWDQGIWWGDDLTLTGGYFDPIAAANIVFLHDRAMRASSASGGPKYATEITVPILGDARGGKLYVQAHGMVNTNDPSVALYVRDVSYTSIRGVSWAPQTGKFWVAADAQVDEIDVFRFAPVKTAVAAGLNTPFLSRVTSTGEILYVEGTLGVAEVKVINVSSLTVSTFALTTDQGFTRPVLPVGIAVSPDASKCFIADASGGPGAGAIVMIPRGNAEDIIDGYGGSTAWSFPVPCGMDASPDSSTLYAASTDGWTYQINEDTTTPDWYWGVEMRSIYVDQELSTDGLDRFVLTTATGLAEGFNLNPIGWSGADPPSGSARYLGGLLFATSGGHLNLQNQVLFGTAENRPQRVVLFNPDPEFPYTSTHQTIDRVIRIDLVAGWSDVPLHLRLIDPPDLAAYDDKDLDNPADFGAAGAAFPYEAADNRGTTDNGITLNPDGSSPVMELTTTQRTIYLKVPANFSGDNFQLEMTKCDPLTSTPLPQRVVALSPVFTSWKRVLVETERMFRRGGLLALDYEYDPSCQVDCNRVAVFEPTIVAVDDLVTIFDTTNGPQQSNSETAYVEQKIPGPGSTSWVYLRDRDGNQFIPIRDYDASSDQDDPSNPILDLTDGRSAGIGVVFSSDGQLYDTESNQLNAPGSCFFDVDTDKMEETFGDAFVEIRKVRYGLDWLPYLFNLFGPNDGSRWWFSWLWFNHSNLDGIVHLMGAQRDPAKPEVYGVAVRCLESALGNIPVRGSFVYVNQIEDDADPSSGACFMLKPPEPVNEAITIHELVHQYPLNPLIPEEGEHCQSKTWFSAGDECLMNADDLTDPFDTYNCPGVDPTRLDADEMSQTSPNGGDLYDVRFASDRLE